MCASCLLNFIEGIVLIHGLAFLGKSKLSKAYEIKYIKKKKKKSKMSY